MSLSNVKHGGCLKKSYALRDHKADCENAFPLFNKEIVADFNCIEKFYSNEKLH